MTKTAVTAPGLGGMVLIIFPEHMSKIKAFVSSHPTMARWESAAMLNAKT